MKIISGTLKGRKIKMPAGNEIRPTSGKVKEAIFSIIGHDLSNTLVVDLFAGTGSLGLEAVSRNAQFVWLNDKSMESYQLIRENVKKLDLEDRTKLLRGDFKHIIPQIKREVDQVDVILLDPPFIEGILEAAIEEISDSNLLKDDGIIVAEHDIKLILPEKIGRYSCYKTKKYGKTLLSLYGIDTFTKDY